MKSTSLKKRIDWVDALKFLGILYIFLGHMGDAGGRLYYFVFEFHLPLFFFISGFFFNYDRTDKFSEYFKKNFRSYIIPYLLFNIIIVVLWTIRDNLGVKEILASIFNIFLGKRNTLYAGGTWFILCLFIIKIFCFFIHKITTNKIIIFFICLVLYYIPVFFFSYNPLITTKFIWNIDSAMMYIIYFALGDIFYKFNERHFKKRTQLSEKIIIILISTVIVLISAIDYFYGRNFISSFLSLKFHYSFDLLITLILILNNVIFAYFLRNIKVLCNIGQQTLYLCCIEHLTKTIIIDIIALVGIELSFHNPLITIIYVIFVLYIDCKYAVPLAKKIHNDFNNFILGVKNEKNSSN